MSRLERVRSDRIPDFHDRERERRASAGKADSLTSFAEALSLVPHLVGQLERAIELHAAASASAEPEPLPKGVRSTLRELVAVLALAPSTDEILRLAGKLDLRDLSEAEVAYLEKVTVKTVQSWRTTGAGPAYRNEAGIRYPLRWYWEWREGGRQRLTAQNVRRGQKPD